MSLLNIFKKKKTSEKDIEEKKAEKKKIEKKEKIKEKPEFSSEEREDKGAVVSSKKVASKKKLRKVKQPTVKKKTIQQKKVVSDRAYWVLSAPHISEKATDLSEKKNEYVFRVKPMANKVEVKKAIEDIYGVKVLAVKIINVHRKKRRMGRQIGWRKGYKKAIVKVREGQKIELLSR